MTHELMLDAGCSGIQWESEQHDHIWGRNFDFNRIAEGTGITYVSKGLEYYTIGSELEKNLDDKHKVTATYSAMGMGSYIMKPTPVLYEGVNECGLMGGQLYYREFARYEEENPENKKEIQPAYIVTYVLTQCRNVEDVKKMFKDDIIVKKVGIFGKIPDIHWFFSDTEGKSVVVELDDRGLNLFDTNLGALTNSPDYRWHMHHLREFANLQPKDVMNQTINGQALTPCYSGTGMTGLPGDWSAPSRFVRLALMREYGVKGKDEKQAVARTFRLLQNVAFPLGLVAVGDTSDVGKHDGDVIPFDYTVYTAVMCGDSKTYYWHNYDDMEVHSISMDDFVDDGTCQVKLLEF